MSVVTIEFPEDAMSALRREPVGTTSGPGDFVETPGEFAEQMRLAAAIHWYSRGRLSQEMAARVAGLSRAAFLDALAREEVDALQVDIEELAEEVDRALGAHRGHLAPHLPDQGGPPGSIDQTGAPSPHAGRGSG